MLWGGGGGGSAVSLLYICSPLYSPEDAALCDWLRGKVASVLMHTWPLSNPGILVAGSAGQEDLCNVV